MRRRRSSRIGLVLALGALVPRAVTAQQDVPQPSGAAFLLVPAGVQGPGFLMLPNFRVIMKYNPAEAYALAIGHLADRLRGGGPFAQSWPRYERVLSRDERLELQQLLARRGYDVLRDLWTAELSSDILSSEIAFQARTLGRSPIALESIADGRFATIR